ncbi:unnamed protein product, partial [Urochloa humidicola]
EATAQGQGNRRRRRPCDGLRGRAVTTTSLPPPLRILLHSVPPRSVRVIDPSGARAGATKSFLFVFGPPFSFSFCNYITQEWSPTLALPSTLSTAAKLYT